MTIEYAYSMNKYVSRTRNSIFYDCICVNDTEWNYSMMSNIADDVSSSKNNDTEDVYEIILI